MVDMDGSDRRKVAAGGPHPVWSPNGSRILYRDGDSSGDWWVVDVDGTDRRRFGPAAVWSPDGSRIVYSSGDGMFERDATSGSSRRIAYPGSTPRWWPDDTGIFYTRADALWVVGADGRIVDGSAPDWVARACRLTPPGSLGAARTAACG